MIIYNEVQSVTSDSVEVTLMSASVGRVVSIA